MKAAGEGDEQLIRHIPLREAQFLRTAAVHSHVELGQVEGLLYSCVRHTGDVSDTVQELLREYVVGRDVEATHLDVDWRRRAEVEDLGHDVRGKKCE